MRGLDAAAVKAMLEGLHGIPVTEARAAEIARDVTLLAAAVREAAAALTVEDEASDFAAALAAQARRR